jgi:hypothetical protein
MKRPFWSRHRVFMMGVLCVAGAVLFGCAPTAVLRFHPDRLSPGTVNYASRLPYRFGFVRFRDERYVPAGSGDYLLIGWGTGTGTLETRTNVSRFVTESFVRSFRHLGIRARAVSVKGLEGPADLAKHLGTLASDYPDVQYLVMGEIQDFQFQISHPRLGVGTEFSLLATDVAWIKCQERITLHVFSAISGRSVGSFTSEVYTIRKTRGKSQTEFIREAERTLDRNLASVVMKAVGHIDTTLRKAPP